MIFSLNTTKLSNTILESLSIPSVPGLSPSELKDKIRGVIFGNALGDALGLRTEFQSTSSSKSIWGSTNLQLLDWPEYRRSLPRADWTDDTDQMILIIDGFLHSSSVNQQDFARRLIDWRDHGFSELGDSKGMGIGSTVNSVLKQPGFTEDPFLAAFDVWEKSWYQLAANGALMRSSVLGVIGFQDLRQVVKQTIEITNVTHADPRCVATCTAFTSFIALTLLGHSFESAYEYSVEIGKRTLEVYTSKIEKKMISLGKFKFREKFEKEKNESFLIGLFEKYLDKELDQIGPFDREDLGYTYLCFGTAFWAVRQVLWTDAIREICIRGGDADTNAAVAGAALGCKVGFRGLPGDLVQQMIHFECLWQKVERLLSVLVPDEV